MSKQITILGDRVLVEPFNDTQTLVHTIDNTKWRYKVTSVGLGRTTESGYKVVPPVNVGDIIIVDPSRVVTVEISGKWQKLVNSPDIIARE
jgi:co-chaperonin GroES (HSP10)